MKRDLFIRPARVEDAVAIARVHVQAWQETYVGLVPQSLLDEHTIKRRELLWRELLSRQETLVDGAVFVAELGDDLVGFGSCCGQRDETLFALGFVGEISTLYLLQRAQGRGIGRALFLRMKSWLATLGASALSLWVLEGNWGARQFYERLGGQMVDEKMDVREMGTLVEVAYGWR